MRLPGDLHVAGEEHLFYTEAGKYTGIFWDVSKESVKNLPSLELISLKEAKSQAPSKCRG